MKSLSRRPRIAAGALAVIAAVFLPATGRSQSAELDLAPAAGQFEPAPLPPPAEPSIIPDLPLGTEGPIQVRDRYFTMKFGFVSLLDYTAFSQDQASVTQVGRQEDQWQARSSRVMLHGTIGDGYKVSYQIAAEYKGFDTDPAQNWASTDVSFTFPLGGPATKLTVGKTKESFSYEMVGDAANLPQQERVLSPFFVSRNVGAKITQVIGDLHRMTASAGVYNDWFVTGDKFSGSGTDVAARVTGLLWDEAKGTDFLHLGVAGRYVGGDDNTLRYRGRPESNVADYYVDTGNLAADHAWQLGLEALWNKGPFSVLAEYNQAWVSSAASRDPSFSGYYITGSWILTGETRPYDRTVGYARRVQPTGRWGAPELVARFSHVNLNDADVQGGSFNKTYFGVNWWATRRWKLGVGWGRTWLDRTGLSGVTDSVLSRMQWVY